MSRLLSTIFSIILIASFTLPPIISLIEKGTGICHVDFGDETEKKENQETEKDTLEVYVASNNDFAFMSIALAIRSNGNEQANYYELALDVFIPPPEQQTNFII